MSETASEGFARFAVGLEADSIPPGVLEAAGLHFLDVLGCGALAAASGAGEYTRAFADDGPGAAAAIGLGCSLAPEMAALVNGIRCHALDFDDTHPGSIAHISAVVAPAALAATQAVGARGEELLLALIAGNEIACRIGRPVGDGFHHRGFHPTAICGIFGATAAVARATDLGSEGLVQALGIAGSMAAGLMAYLSDGSATKPIHAGWMAHSAHMAVRLAAAGATGPAAVLEGRNGVYQAFVDLPGVDGAALAADLGENWETPAIAFKPYAACHFIHAPLDALLTLREEERFEPAAVERITFVSPRAGVELVADPIERKRRPQTPYEGKFSAPFAFAVALLTGRTDPLVFAPEFLDSAEVHALADRVDFEVREYETFPASLPGGVRVELADGRVLERHLDHQHGGAANPLRREQVVEKFRINSGAALPAALVGRLEEAALDLAAVEDLAVFDLLEAAGVGGGEA